MILCKLFAFIEVYTSPKNSLNRAAMHHDIVYRIAGNSKKEKPTEKPIDGGFNK